MVDYRKFYYEVIPLNASIRTIPPPHGKKTPNKEKGSKKAPLYKENFVTFFFLWSAFHEGLPHLPNFCGCPLLLKDSKGVNPGGDGGDISPTCFDMGGITCLLSPPCFDPQICCFLLFCKINNVL